MDAGFRERVYRVVRLIPSGRVATYGDIAYLAGAARQARHVGWALRTLPPGLAWGSAGPGAAHAAAPDASTELPVPWHRVVNAQGCVSRHPDPDGRSRQIALLRREGLTVADDGALAGGLAAYAWWPEPALLETIDGERPE